VKPVELVASRPLILTISEAIASELGTFDAGAAYTRYLHDQAGDFPSMELGDLVDAVGESVNPRSPRQANVTFEYVDLREVDDIYGQILTFRRVKGTQIGSTKVRFRRGDILFAKIMPSLANKKVALVTQDVANAVASTEFIVLRPKPDSGVDLYFLFRALRSDAFTEQAVANVTGATGRQRLTPGVLLSLRVPVPPVPLQEELGSVVDREFTMRNDATELAKQADDLAAALVGATTLRTARYLNA
jgi:hypothetical protein